MGFLNGKVRDAELSTLRLKTEADKAHAQAEGFKAQIASANAEADKAKLRVAEIERSALPRSLKQQEISDRLRSFKGTRVFVETVADF